MVRSIYRLTGNLVFILLGSIGKERFHYSHIAVLLNWCSIHQHSAELSGILCKTRSSSCTCFQHVVYPDSRKKSFESFWFREDFIELEGYLSFLFSGLQELRLAGLVREGLSGRVGVAMKKVLS